MRRLAALLAGVLALVTLFPCPAVAQDLIVPFTDEAAQDTEFLAYRSTLAAAVAARDADAAAALADAEILLSFGGDGGRETFRDWLAHGPAGDEASADGYWQSLAAVLALGGRFESPDLVTAPYFWSAALPDTLDPYLTYVVITRMRRFLPRPVPMQRCWTG